MWMAALVPWDSLTVTSLYSSNIYGTSRFTEQFCINYLTHPDNNPVIGLNITEVRKNETPRGHQTCPKLQGQCRIGLKPSFQTLNFSSSSDPNVLELSQNANCLPPLKN